MEEFEKLFTTKDLAKTLEEKGFSSLYYNAFAHYETNGLIYFVEPGDSQDHLSAPLWQQVFDWLRIEHKILIILDHDAKTYFWCVVEMDKDRTVSMIFDEETYEQAREHAVEHALTLIV